MVEAALDLRTITERLERVESQDRQLRRIVIALLLGVVVGAGLGLYASKPPTVVEAREFVLRDDDGNMRALWTTSASGVSSLHLLDRAGAAHASLSVTPKGAPRLALVDSRGNPVRPGVSGAEGDGGGGGTGRSAVR
jgi:hypothetical protein